MSWLYRDKSCSIYTQPQFASVYQYGEYVCSFSEDGVPSDDDLTLMLAAPDMLKALYVAREALAGDKYACRIIEAAIHKATGESQ
jgi:hypothetical protein